MSTITQIVTGLKNTLANNMSNVDQASIDGYLPPINTADTALVIPAFGQESQFGEHTFAAGATYQSHRIRCEFWVKDKGDPASLMSRARQVANDAVRVLFDNATLGGVVETVGFYDGDRFDFTIESNVADQAVQVGNARYIPVTVIVPVCDFSLP